MAPEPAAHPAAPLEGELDSSLPPFFDPAEASRGYAAGGFVLAGFCFAAIVLILKDAAAYPDRYGPSLSALLTAFLGCVVSAFVLSLVTGQTRRSERSFWLGLLGGITLGTAALFALWGVSELIRVASIKKPDAAVITLSYGVFAAAGIVVSGFILVIGIDLWRIAINDDMKRYAGGGQTRLHDWGPLTQEDPQRAGLLDEAKKELARYLQREIGWLLGAQGLAFVVPFVALLPVHDSGKSVVVQGVAWLELAVLVGAVVAALALSAAGRHELLDRLTPGDAKGLVRVLVAIPPLVSGVLLGIMVNFG